MARSLCKLEDLPNHLQFNKDILTGYRRPMTTKECIHSWTYMHNESFNCYSHCIALVYFLYVATDYFGVWPTHPDASTTVKFLILNDLMCSILPFALSIVYHTFMPHITGEPTYKWLLKTDILGVWWICTFGPICNVYVSLFCTPALMALYAFVYSLLSAYVLFYMMIHENKQKRTVALTLQFALRVLLYPLRVSSLSRLNISAMYYYISMDAVSAFGALVNALHVPERWWPGKLDYVLNGHNLMHVAAVTVVMIARQGFLSDIKWLSEVGTCPM